MPFLFLLLLTPLIGLAPVGSSPRQTPPVQPNILWITCEDMSPHLGSYGERVAKTPHLDQLAREGRRYTQFFSVSGVCAPSRSAIITGMYPTSVGTQHMRTTAGSAANGTFPAGIPTYSAVLPPAVKCFPEYLRRAGYFCTNNEKTDYQFDAPVTAWNENGKQAHWRHRAEPNQPFFSVFNLLVTHESFVWLNAQKPLRVNPEAVSVPPYYPDNAVVRGDIARFLSNVEEMDDRVGEILAELKADGLYDNTIIVFFADHGDGLPYVKREILDRGLRVPFLVRFPGGNRAGTLDTTLHSFVDLAPTMLSLAGVPLPKYLQGQAFLGDQTAHSPRRYVFASRDRMDSETDRVRAVHDGRFEYLRNFYPELPYYQNIAFRKQQPMMREILRLRDAGALTTVQQRWFGTKPPEELYDLRSDPHQFNNLIADPTHAAKRAELRQALDTWLKTVGDRGAESERAMLLTMWPDLRQPTTAPPVVRVQGQRLALNCPTPGASITYKTGHNGRWLVYTQPVAFAPADTLLAKAIRIGFKESAVVRSR